MFAIDFWKELGYRGTLSRKPSSLNSTMLTYRSKSGPNGHALVSSYIDAKALPEDLIKDLTLLGGDKLLAGITVTKHDRM
jgi:hypothetical protein